MIYTITDESRVKNGDFYEMLSSLYQINVEVYVGLRGKVEISREIQNSIQTIQLPLKISLSKARNQLLSEFPPKPDSLVLFLDDDAQLTADFRNNFQCDWDKYDFKIGRLSYWKSNNVKPKMFDIENYLLGLKLANSCTMVIKSSCISNFSFDENLGLGTEFMSGEDQDLFLYLIASHKLGIMDSRLVVSHPQKDVFSTYFPGSIAVLQKYSQIVYKAKFYKYKRLLHGIIYFILGRIDRNTLLMSFKAAKRKAIVKLHI